ncbi:MAG: Ger(x)C family spore germination protein [Clostridiaceae bacterium]|nr:Ger(x)C family spore germination protein [Clostridiaceae bacterium]
MKGIKLGLFAILMSLNAVLSTGCWNYREIDDVDIVAGVAVDKGTTAKYLVTVEIVQVSGGRESKTSSDIISIEGESMFDAARNQIAVSGKRLYWAHSKVIIISEDIAREGLLDVIDWYLRDAETREDVNILVSRADTAREILVESMEDKAERKVKSFELENIINNQRSLSKAPNIQVWELINRISKEGYSTVAPTVSIKKEDGKKIPQIIGTAIFEGDKLIGFINGQETQEMLIVQNELKGGVLIGKTKNAGSSAALEIFSCKAKIKPIVNGNSIHIRVSIDMTTAIDEIDSAADLIGEEGRKDLEQGTEAMLEKQIGELIKKIQSDYGADIFGFGRKVMENNPEVWRGVGKNWKKEFENLKVSVDVNVHIKNSAVLSKPLKVGD